MSTLNIDTDKKKWSAKKCNLFLILKDYKNIFTKEDERNICGTALARDIKLFELI